MSELIVVGFDQLEDARTAMSALRAVERMGGVGFEDTALVERTADGKVHTRNELSGATETGAVVGGAIGAMLTFVFPLAGVVVGAAVGGAIGSLCTPASTARS
jgi:uncharacterized membrane protein